MDSDVKLSAVFITYQCLFLDYPIEEVLRCCLDLCDDIYINDGGSEDGTLDLFLSLQRDYGKDRLHLFENKWTHDRGFWARERNVLMDKIPQDNYVLNIAADECFHEDDLIKIRETLPNLNTDYGMRFWPYHFFGRPTHHKVRGWAKVLTKIWKNSANIKYKNIQGGCADDPVWPNGAFAHWSNVYDSGVRVYHYGHSRHPEALIIKSKKADSLYRGESNYVDGSFPEVKSFDYRFEEHIKGGSVVEFKGTHPKYMKDWVDRHKDQETVWRRNET